MPSVFKVNQQVRVRRDADVSGLVYQEAFERWQNRRTVGVIRQYDPQPGYGFDACVEFEGEMHWFGSGILEAVQWFTVIIRHEDEAEETDSEELVEGVPAGYGYLSTLLEAPDFVRVEFQTGLIHTTIIRME